MENKELPSEIKEVKESAEEILKEVRCNIHKYDLPKEKRDKLWKVANDIALLNKKESLLNLFEKFWNKEAGFVVFERFLYACMNEYAAQFNQSVPVSEYKEMYFTEKELKETAQNICLDRLEQIKSLQNQLSEEKKNIYREQGWDARDSSEPYTKQE